VDRVVVLDFGGQYSHLISRRIRDLGVYSEVLLPSTKRELMDPEIKGLILSGGAASVYDVKSPKCDREILNLGIPVLGICYGHQLIAYLKGGDVTQGETGEYGITDLTVNEGRLLSGLTRFKVWMNHNDTVKKLPNYTVTASTPGTPIAAFENSEKKIYGVQFHPEVTHTENGEKILENFVFGICETKQEWNTSNIIDRIITEIKDEIGEKKAVIGLSGGVDSSTAAVLMSRAIGKLTAIYVDTGLMREGETKLIEGMFSEYENINLKIVKAESRFFKALKGVADPEEKRKIIGKLFIDVFEEIAQEEGAKVLIQGTIYSDRIESGITEHSSVIKSHHNVGGLPEDINLEICEPLKDLYKDEVRKIAKNLGLPDEIINRHVFPGPGLAVRVVGEVTPERVKIVRKASHIIEDELSKAGLYNKVWMAFAVLLPIKSVGVQGDARSYKYPVVVRILESKDAMTANFAKVSYEVLEKISTRITNEINEVNRVVYDISNKPPATMEWE